MIEASVKSSDLLYLSLAIYDNPNARKTLLIVPGINEYKERYNHVINYFYNAHYSIVIFDPRSHGKSVNDFNSLGYFDDAGKLIDDLKIVVNYTKNRFPNNLISILADSLGALVAINYLQDNAYISKVALVSPLYQESGDTNLKAAKFLLGVMGKSKESSYFQNILGFGKDSVLLKDIKEINIMKNDSKCFYNYKNISVYEILRLQSNLKKLKWLNNFEVLIQSGSLDHTLCAKDKIIAILKKGGLTKISSLEYPNMGHKLLFESEKDLVMQDILSFLEN